ncbi:MAG: NADH-quinone oxidoreductase subunit, partial [Thermoanaerobaculia bacterium]|nr:NADH-quinone oxidoreductase subunit [Thermoanaerobaculia bacterium]
MSTLTKFSAIPYTGPAPTNREPYVPVGVAIADARGAVIANALQHPAMIQETGQDMASFIVDKENIIDVLRTLKESDDLAFTMPLDLFAVDYPNRKIADRESGVGSRSTSPDLRPPTPDTRRPARFDVIYQLYSLKNNERIRLKVRVGEDEPIPTGTGIYKGLNWYEREVFDMYGVVFDGHPNLRRILTHEAFQGHPLRKDYDPAQRWLLTEKDVAKITPVIDPRFENVDTDYERVTLNLGPSHPATHGTLRIVVTLDGETIIGADQEIGYLHRCFEKMSETHTYQQVIPYTDRLNYCSAIIN